MRCLRTIARSLLPALLPAALLPDPARAALTVPDDFVDEVVYLGLDQSVGMAILPDSRVFVVEQRSANIRLIVNGAPATVDPVIQVPDVDSDVLEEGLLGIAVDPGWPARPFIYIHYNHALSPYIRVSRYTVGGDLAFTGDGSLTIDPESRYHILTGLPDDAPYHNGGTLRFGPDGMLYCSIGDDYNPCKAQDLSELHGSILRMDVSALPTSGGGGPPPKSAITPPDNPLIGHPNENARLRYHWGLRNPFRFAIDPVTGEIAVGDVGESEAEEINFLSEPGRNLQWPAYEGYGPGPLTWSCAGIDSSTWTAPVHVYDHNEGAAVVAGVIYRRPPGATSPFPPEYEGDIFFSDFYAPWVRRLKRNGSAWGLEAAAGQPGPSDWGLDLGASLIADWAIAPDGSLYYCRIASLFGNGPGEIRRIRYTGVVSVPAPGAPGVEFRPPFPSPSRGGVTFDYALAAPGRVSIHIFDVSGRMVGTLVDAEAQAGGTHRATWDGRDASGRRAAAGVYLARLSVSGRTFERRLALID